MLNKRFSAKRKKKNKGKSLKNYKKNYHQMSYSLTIRILTTNKKNKIKFAFCAVKKIQNTAVQGVLAEHAA